MSMAGRRTSARIAEAAVYVRAWQTEEWIRSVEATVYVSMAGRESIKDCRQQSLMM
jgi:uncharacterized protein CbrC (UPF0167 family)